MTNGVNFPKSQRVSIKLTGGYVVGHIYTRKRNKTWEYSFELAKVDQKRKKVSKGGFKTKADALVAGTKAMADYNEAGISFVPSELSFNDFLDLWIDTYCSLNMKEVTLINYKKKIRLHIKPALTV